MYIFYLHCWNYWKRQVNVKIKKCQTQDVILRADAKLNPKSTILTDIIKNTTTFLARAEIIFVIFSPPSYNYIIVTWVWRQLVQLSDYGFITQLTCFPFLKPVLFMSHAPSVYSTIWQIFDIKNLLVCFVLYLYNTSGVENGHVLLNFFINYIVMVVPKYKQSKIRQTHDNIGNKNGILPNSD